MHKVEEGWGGGEIKIRFLAKNETEKKKKKKGLFVTLNKYERELRGGGGERERGITTGYLIPRNERKNKGK